MHLFHKSLICNPFRVLIFLVATQRRPSRNRANAGLNDTIRLGLKNRQFPRLAAHTFSIPPKTAKNPANQSKLLSMNYLRTKSSLPDQAQSRLIKANQDIRMNWPCRLRRGDGVHFTFLGAHNLNPNPAPPSPNKIKIRIKIRKKPRKEVECARQAVRPCLRRCAPLYSSHEHSQIGIKSIDFISAGRHDLGKQILNK